MSGTTTPPLPVGVRAVRETAPAATVPIHAHPEWSAALPWLAQGTTGAGGDDGYDLGLAGRNPVGAALRRWRGLREATGMAAAVHSLQVHGTEILSHPATPPGLRVVEGYDGHETAAPGILITVSVADCVPISIIDPDRRRVALLHGGWRGTARGILAAGLDRLGGDRARLLVHLGPAICGDCYEVGPEVHEALGLPAPGTARPVDVRAVLARQAVAAGVPPDRVTVSDHCTRRDEAFYSYRGGDAGRQVGLLGIRP